MNAPAAQPAVGGLNFPKTFGEGTETPVAGKVTPKLWLNIGYTVKSNVEGEEDKFVSLPLGIALDTQAHLPTTAKNEQFARFQQARNSLLDQLNDVGKLLKPGEAKLVAVGANGLSIQIRRINDDAPELPTEGNPFAIKLAF